MPARKNEEQRYGIGAVAAAAPGSIIRIRPGEYFETVVITKDLILGDKVIAWVCMHNGWRNCLAIVSGCRIGDRLICESP